MTTSNAWFNGSPQQTRQSNTRAGIDFAVALSLSEYSATAMMRATMTTDEREAFHKQLVVKGFMVNGTGSDGNCLCRSIAQAMFGNQERHAEVRAAIVEYMRVHKVEFAGFDELSGGNYGEYAVSGAWGTSYRRVTVSRPNRKMK